MTVEIPDGDWRLIKLDLRDAQQHAYHGRTGAAHEYLRVVNERIDEIENADDN